MAQTDAVQESESAKYRRIRRLKRLIIYVPFSVILILLVICIFLGVRLHMVRKELQNALARLEATSPAEQADTDTGTRLEYGTDTLPYTVSGVDKSGRASPRTDDASSIQEEEDNCRKVYLTFDDGPSKQTERVLNILKKKKVKATFFAIGREDEFSQNIYRRIVKEGHTLGMHSYSHIFKEIYGSLDGFKKDFHRISDYLEKVTGARPVFYRFPGGSSNTVNELPVEQYTNFLKEQGVEYVDWNVIAANGITENVTKKDMVRSVMEGVAKYDTSIVLLYDSADKKMTADSLSAMIDSLQAAGYELLPMDDSTVPIHHS